MPSMEEILAKAKKRNITSGGRPYLPVGEAKIIETMDHVAKAPSPKGIKNETSINSFKVQIQKLENENKLLKSQKEYMSRSLNNNLNKFINAIQEETKLQGTKWPIISTTTLRNIYKVSSNSFSACLSYGLDMNIFERKKAVYSGNVSTYSYKIL